MIEVGDLVSYKKHFSVQTPGFSARCGFVCAAIENKRTVISSPLHQREVKVVWLDGATSWEGEGFLDKIKGVKEMSAFTRKFEVGDLVWWGTGNKNEYVLSLVLEAEIMEPRTGLKGFPLYKIETIQKGYWEGNITRVAPFQLEPAEWKDPEGLL